MAKKYNLNDILEYKILLGSKSPRRLEILKQMGFKIKQVAINVDESFDKAIAYYDIPEYISNKKLKAYDTSILKDKEIFLTADTMVFLNEKPLGKPKDEKQAFQFLKMLSGNKHLVITGCSIATKHNSISFSQTTEVYFKNLSIEEIKHYVENYKPLDKAGGYAIQQWIGMIGIEKINGCFYNVVGLPSEKLFFFLQKLIEKENSYLLKNTSKNE
ncbi:MAG: Maf family protein [Bacteroidales bacterium]|jgi:septum formation protein|nr:Maf family protein [Bacteroidales bacterium]